MEQQIIISGGGVPGLVLAILLGQEGIKVTVIDPVKPTKLKKLIKDGGAPKGHTTALLQTSLDIIEKCGVMDDIRSLCGRMNTMRIIDVTGQDRIEKSFDSLEIDQNTFGMNVPGMLLRSALAEKAATLKPVTLLFGQSLSDFSSDAHGVTVRLDNKKELRGKLLVGADGRHSVVRAVARIETIDKDYNQDALTCLVSHTKDHRATSTEFHRPGGPLTFVPLGEKTSSVVWVERRGRARQLAAMPKAEFQAALQNASKDILGELTVRSDVGSRELKIIGAKKLTAPRVALAAEAAHAIHPMGAQGLNLSLRDIDVLQKLILRRCGLGLDPGASDMLTQYERQRKIDIAGRLAATHGLVTSLTHNNRIMHQIRRAGLKAITSLSPLKTALMRAGMTGR